MKTYCMPHRSMSLKRVDGDLHTVETLKILNDPNEDKVRSKSNNSNSNNKSLLK